MTSFVLLLLQHAGRTHSSRGYSQPHPMRPSTGPIYSALLRRQHLPAPTAWWTASRTLALVPGRVYFLDALGACWPYAARTLRSTCAPARAPTSKGRRSAHWLQVF
jgi:hypothetical protein